MLLLISPSKYKNYKYVVELIDSTGEFLDCHHCADKDEVDAIMDIWKLNYPITRTYGRNLVK